MEQLETNINKELQMTAQYLAQSLIPDPGAVPRVNNIDIHGMTIPLNGVAGGDLVTYVDFQDRYDLEARIARALARGEEAKAQMLQRLKRKGGIMVADVSGHEFTDAIRALLLHQVFHACALYEMDQNGNITTRLFEQVNTRFFKSRTLRRLAADLDSTSFITLIYGEISHTGRFRFVSAGHPPPLVFSRAYNRFVEISPNRLVSYPPLGLQLTEDHPDAKLFKRVLGYKKKYTTNDLNLMGQGDVLLLYTDGLIDTFSSYTIERLERSVALSKDGSAKDICEAIIADRKAASEQSDDLSLVVIKYR
ncbi:MAG: serine/threonine-protein phosphatase [Acidobacteria bacterium]|nr:serine/threonine-protein phosphatase [Acidobacteriota bacterium]